MSKTGIRLRTLAGYWQPMGLDHTIMEIADMADREVDERSVPRGFEWPKWSDGEPVVPGECGVTTVELFAYEWKVWAADGEPMCAGRYGETAPRPATVGKDGETIGVPVLAADGKPLEVGQTVYNVGLSDARVIDHIEYEHGGTPNVYYEDGEWDYPDLITHQRPVLDADGVPINAGDTVWPKYPDSDPRNAVESAEVVYVHGCGRVDVQAKYETGLSFKQQVDAKQLTHTKPEPPDSMENVAHDLLRMAKAWCSQPKLIDAQRCASEEVGESTMNGALHSLACRCRALAERGER